MPSILSLDEPNAPPATPPTGGVNWLWSVEAVKAALLASGTPPNLDIQSMLNAAFAIDGAPLCGEIFAGMIGDRVRELDATPYILPVESVAAVEITGQFLLLLLTGRLDQMRAVHKPMPAPAAPVAVDAIINQLDLELPDA